MKALKIILAVLVVAILVFWLGWLRAPSAESVCDNLMSIAQEELGSELYESPEECADDYQRGLTQSIFSYVEEMKCYKNAETLADVEVCDAL